MSNAYIDTMLFKKDDKFFTGICFKEADYCLDQMNYEYCDLITDDIKCVRQMSNIPSNWDFKTKDGKLLSSEEILKQFEVLIVNVGMSYYDYENKKPIEHYKKTLYAFHNDWLMCDNQTQELFVVNEEHIKEYKLIGKKI